MEAQRTLLVKCSFPPLTGKPMALMPNVKGMLKVVSRAPRRLSPKASEAIGLSKSNDGAAEGMDGADAVGCGSRVSDGGGTST